MLLFNSQPWKLWSDKCLLLVTAICYRMIGNYTAAAAADSKYFITRADNIVLSQYGRWQQNLWSQSVFEFCVRHTFAVCPREVWWTYLCSLVSSLKKKMRKSAVYVKVDGRIKKTNTYKMSIKWTLCDVFRVFLLIFCVFVFTWIHGF